MRDVFPALLPLALNPGVEYIEEVLIAINTYSSCECIHFAIIQLNFDAGAVDDVRLGNARSEGSTTRAGMNLAIRVFAKPELLDVVEWDTNVRVNHL